MPKILYHHSKCYVYNFLTKEFLVQVTTCGRGKSPNNPQKIFCRWSPVSYRARAYKNPEQAAKAATRINAEVYDYPNPKYPCAPVQMVTGMAARCLDLINRRGSG